MGEPAKRKLSFIPVVRGSLSSQGHEDEDLLNKEMDDIFHAMPDDLTNRKHHDGAKNSDANSKPLSNVPEETSEETTELLRVNEATKARMSEILEEMSDLENEDSYNEQENDDMRRKESESISRHSNVSAGNHGENDGKRDHTPHDLFIQLNELHGSGEFQEWRETARWIKYEEDVEEGADRWGRPHVSSLSFHSLLNVRRCLETGVVLLEAEEKDLPNIVHSAVEAMFLEGEIRAEDREKIFKTLLLHHNYEHHHGVFHFGLHKHHGSNSKLNLNGNGVKTSQVKNASNARRLSRRTSTAVYHPASTGNFMCPIPMVLEEKKDLLDVNGHDTKIVVEQEEQMIQNEYLLKRLPPHCEGAAVLTGIADFLEQPTIAFIRLAEAVKMPNVLEVAVPVRFIFILMGPNLEDLDYHELGRSISTLMSNKHFHNQVYKAKYRHDLLIAINDFLDDSIVLPPGKFDKETLLPFEELKEKADMIRMRKRRAMCDDLKSHSHMLSDDQLKFLAAKFDACQKKPDSPLERTGRLWGGLINDIKRRLPMFKSDIVDGFNNETLAATVFLYFACFASAITFGGLASDLLDGKIGISETLLSACFVGMIFHLLGGQPLVIVGTTGPLILFDKALYDFCDGQGYDFLNIRAYVGGWMMIIAIVVSAFEGSTLVKLFTRFTQEIFSALITLIYLYSTFNKTVKVYKKNPLTETPNTALFCTMLTLGTFVLAYGLKIFRNSHFLGRTSRRALGDFGVPISIAIFAIIANVLSEIKTDKLSVPDGIKPSLERPWLVPLWKEENPVWLPVACVVPGFLVYIVAFMESHISELILNKPERKLKKGCGFHWDIVLLCILNSVCGLLGMPWHCSAVVKSVAHISAVTVMSTNHPPGESPHIVGVKEQRLSGFFVSLFFGLSILAAPLLKKIPISVLFGVFLYMGVSSMKGVQFFERIVLLFMPVKYHHGSYATKVLTYRMHIYTIIQLVALSILWIVNESSISLAFPFFLIMMVPLRKALENFYSPSELEALDGEQQHEDDDIDDDDFYEQTHWPA